MRSAELMRLVEGKMPRGKVDILMLPSSCMWASVMKTASI
jgi:hypothetical protein